MADAEYKVAYQPYDASGGYEILGRVHVAIHNPDGFTPQEDFLLDLRSTWDGLTDKEILDLGASIERQTAKIGAAYSTDTKAVLRCELDIEELATVDDANRLIRATQITLGRFGIVATAELIDQL